MAEKSASVSAAQNKPYTASNREMYAWGIGGVANHSLICTFGQVTNMFILGFGLSPILVSWVMTIPRLFDGIIDPFLGHLSDNTHTRWGRRKPYLLIGSILAALSLTSIWWVHRAWSPWMQFMYLLVCCTAFYCCWGVYSMAWTAIGYELTDDYHERSRVQGIAGIFLTIVLLVNGWIYWLALRPMFSDAPQAPYTATGFARVGEFISRQIFADPSIHRDEVNGIRWIGTIIAIVAVAAALICTMTCKERFSNVNSKHKKHSALLPALKTTLRNKPFVILLLQRTCGILGGRICGGVAGFLGIYYVCGGDKDLSMKVGGILITYNTICGLALMPFMRHFSRVLGKRKALIMGCFLGLIGALLAPLITRPGWVYVPLIPALIMTPLSIIANTLGDAMLPDICDYDELQSGERREGLFTSVMAFFSKLEMSIAALGVGYLVAWTGYDQALPMQSDITLNRMWWLALIPNILFAAAGLLLILKFPMTEATMNEVRRQLDLRHARAMEADVAAAEEKSAAEGEPVSVAS